MRKRSIDIYAQSKPAARLLCIGDDATLLDSRVKVLQKAGYVVQSCASSDALQWLSKESFDVVLVCRSVPSEQGFAIAREVHVHGLTKIVHLAPQDGNIDSHFDFAIDTTAGPASFLRALGATLGDRSLGNRSLQG